MFRLIEQPSHAEGNTDGFFPAIAGSKILFKIDPGAKKPWIIKKPKQKGWKPIYPTDADLGNPC